MAGMVLAYYTLRFFNCKPYAWIWDSTVKSTSETSERPAGLLPVPKILRAPQLVGLSSLPYFLKVTLFFWV